MKLKMTFLFYFCNLLLFQKIFSLKLNLNALEIPLRKQSQYALKFIFQELRQNRQYDSIVELLNMKTYDATDGYIKSCSSMQADEYKRIVEHFYKNGKRKSLGLILSADCIMAIDKEIFLDTSIAISLRELPKNLMSADKRVFNFRTSSMRGVFCKIVSHAQNQLSLDTDWDNLLVSPAFYTLITEKISLKQTLTTCTTDRINFKDLFYYLNPKMLTANEIHEDILWLIELASPELPLHPPVEELKTLKFIEPKYLNAFNLLLFKTVTSVSFYYQIQDYLTSDSRQALAPVLVEGRRNIMTSLTVLNEFITNLLKLNSPCPPFSKILKLIKTLLNLFIPQLNTSNTPVTKNDVNFLFRSITRTFANYSPKYIQGDWLYNLFFVFIIASDVDRGIHQHLRHLSEESIRTGMAAFFIKNPTNASIKRINLLFKRMICYSLRTFSYKIFELSIPAGRLEEIYEEMIIPTDFLSRRFSEISFEDRFAHFLKVSRKRLGLFDSYYVGAAVDFRSLQFAKPPKFKLNRFLIEQLQATLLALYRRDASSNIIYPYGKFRLIERDLIRKVDIRDCLAKFFELILLIKEFTILKGFDEESSRPIIYITPLLSQPVGSVFGQSLALAIIFNVPIPFLIHPKQLTSIFHNDCKLVEIADFCKSSSGFLNLLEKEQRNNPNGNFRRALEFYFNSFYKWSSLFFLNERGVDVDELVEESISAFHTKVFSGFKFHFKDSKFSFDEISKLLSK